MKYVEKILLHSVKWRSPRLLKAEFKVQATAQEINDLKREAYWFYSRMILMLQKGYSSVILGITSHSQPQPALS